MIRRLKRYGVLLVATVGLGACGGILGGNLFDESFWFGSPLRENTQAELGLAEMAKGNFVTAEGDFKKALKYNSRDVHALLGLGILYQNTGQETKSREMYEAVLAIRPPKSQRFVVWRDLSTRPISEIASVNLALLESGGVLSGLGRGGAGRGDSTIGAVPPASFPGPTAGRGKPVVSGAPSGLAIMGRTAPYPTVSSRGIARRAPGAPAQALPMLSGGDVNIVSRFKTIRDLREQGLITQEEYDARRQANIGALLPLTSPPPASGLDRSVPGSEQISGRLRAIGRALEMRAMTISQHAAERAMILDALMPAAPVVVANPGAPPQGLMQAADAVRRLEFLQNEGLITSDEYSRERLAIEKAIQPAPIRKAKPAKAAPDAEKAMSQARPQAAIQLASYRSRKQAERGWIQLRRKYKKGLRGLRAEITKINLGPGKGIFYRLKAGPVKNKAAAERLCRKLKRGRQFCAPSFMNVNG